MALIDRTLLKATPRIDENFFTAVPPLAWSEWPRPQGSQDPAVAQFRTKFYHSGTYPMSRGLGTNPDISGDPNTSESQVYGNSGYLGIATPFLRANDTITITARPATTTEQTAVFNTCTGTYPWRKTPKYVSGMLMTDALDYGYTEVRMRRPVQADGDFAAIWLDAMVGDLKQEIDIEWVDGDPGKLFTNVLCDMDNYYAKRPTRYVSPANFANDSSVWHTYGIFRSHEKIEWYLDDVLYRSVTNPGCHHTMALIVNLAKDGGWNYGLGNVGQGTETSSMEIDFIRHTDMK